MSALAAATCLATASRSLAEHPNIALNSRGVLPRGEDGRELNLDFETGTLDDWQADGQAFRGQPVRGEIDPDRPEGAGKRSDHTGEYWIGGYEVAHDDRLTGRLTSVPFRVTHPFASFLIGGGAHEQTRVDVVRAEDDRVLFTASGTNQETLRPAVVDLRPYQGQMIYVRIVDEYPGGWGHVNFDDFRFHDEAPQFAHPERVVTGAPAVESLYPYAGLTAHEAAERMEVPAGFSVQASVWEPNVRQPIALAIDGRGRVWVAEAYQYPVRADGDEGKDRILIFEDTNGDGVLDRRRVFIEGLNLVSGLEVGFGGVWVGAAPYLLFIPDADGDGVPDGPPEVLLDGWGYQDTHETLNAFIWGPDGWLYGCHGVFTHSRVGRPGTPDDEREPLNAAIWRYHPLRHEFEVFAHGTSNPWGLDFDDHGQAFCTTCVIPHLFHVIQGARYHRQAGSHFNPHTYDDIQTIADHLHYTGNQWNTGDRRRSDELGGGHAHAGAMIYRGGAWPDEYRGKIFMHNIHGRRVNMDVLRPSGSGYVASHGPDFLLTRDQWSQMLTLDYGPDGQVWMIDWYDENQCHHTDVDAHDRSNGRIYRIAYGDAQPVEVDMARHTDLELAEMQLAENEWYVRHARRLLQERAAAREIDAAAIERLRELALSHPRDNRRLRAIWTLHVTGSLTDPLADQLLDDASPYVRGWIIQLAMERGGHPRQGLYERLADMARADDESPVVRLYIAAALQRMPLESRWEILGALVSHPEDDGDHNLPLMYWYAAEPLADADPRRALAWGLVAGRNVPRLSQFMVRRIGSADPDQSLALLVEGLKQADDAATQLVFLEGMNEALRGRRQLRAPAGWDGALASLVGTTDPRVRLESLVLAATFGDRDAPGRLRELARDAQQPAERRSRALDALLRVQDRQAVELMHELLADSELRGAALRGLAGYDDPRTPQRILHVYADLPLAERRDALATLASRTGYAEQLLEAVAAERVPRAHLTADLVRQLRNLDDPRLNERIERVWGRVRESDADKRELIAQYTRLIEDRSLPQPDVELGRTVFAANCQQCHSLFGTGGDVGPDITGSNRANLEYLLSNVVDPSAVMALEYQPSVILTEGGRILTGIVRQASGEVIEVQTANELLLLPRGEIDEMRLSDQSMMPDDLLNALSDHEVRSMVAYLASPGQTPMLATPENVQQFFNGRDLSGWMGDEHLWTVESGEIVGRSSGLDRNQFLINELAVEDFELTLDVKLVDDVGNSGIQFRSELLDDAEVRGYQADIGPGWWGKLYEEHGRGLLWDESGERHVRPGEWNHYRIEARGSRVRTWINGQLCVDLDDPAGARRGITALQLHAGQPMEVRFRNLQLRLLEE